MRKIVCITGTRPQLVKHSILSKALKKHFEIVSLYTSQHYQFELNDLLRQDLFENEFFYDLKLANNLSPNERLDAMRTEITKFIEFSQPKAILVYGDTDSTLAGALAANKLKITLIHIEAGERSFNTSMPEESNRILTDTMSSILFCVSDIAMQNLHNENNKGFKILSGDIMKDLLLKTAKRFEKPKINSEYIFCTIHRNYNQNNSVKLLQLIETLVLLDETVIFPTHPATFKSIQSLGLNIEGNQYKNIQFLIPLSYSESIHYQKFAKAVITDSGGIQKEAYWLKIPCYTYRKETEWTETLQGNWNRLVYENVDELRYLMDEPLGDYKDDLYGNGHATDIITNKLSHLI